MSATRDPIARPRPALRHVLSKALTAVAARIRAPGADRAHPVLVPVIGSIAVAAAVTVAALLIVANLRDRTIADSGRELRNTALVLAAQTDRAFQALELVESGVIERMQSLGIATSDDFDRQLGEFGMHELLAGRIASLPHIDAVSLINAEGRLVNFSRSWPAPANDLSDRDYFIALKSNPQLTSFISEPLRNRGSGTWVICLARKVTGANGEFLGLVVGSMQLKSFEDFFKSIALGDDGSIALLRRDGVLLARHPHVEPSIARSYLSITASLESDLAQAKHVVRRMTSPFDQQDRLVAAASLAHYPVAVTVTRTVGALLADWQQQARYLAGLTVTLVVVIAGICAAMVRRFRDQSIRLDAALNTMSQGLAMFDSQLRVVVVNRSYCELYRLAPEAVTPGRTLRELIALRSAAGTSPADAEEIHRTTEARLAAGGPWNAIWDMPDGRTVAVSNAPMANGGWLATHEDITERRRAEREILARQAEVERLNAQFAIALSNMAHGLSMYDSDMRLIVCNARYAEIFGIPPELTRPGTPYHAIVAGRTAETTSTDEIVAEMARGRGTARSFTREFTDGRIIAATHQPLADGGFVGVHEDVTARLQAERETLERKAELERVNAQLDVALSNMTHGLCMYDGDMRLIVCNARYAEMYAIPRELTKPGTPYSQLVTCTPLRDVTLEEHLAETERHMATERSVIRQLHDGRIIAVSHRPLANGGWVGVHEDITERRRAEARIEHMARHDALTGLPNRNAFTEKLAALRERAMQENGRFALLLVDLDRFKQVNDVFGHGVGDSLLSEVSRRLAAAAGGAFLARLGGDEFVVLSAQEPQPAATEALAERLQSAFDGGIVIDGQDLLVGLSIGIAIFPGDGDDAEAILGNADAALYRAKAEGRGSIRFFDASMDQRLRDCRVLQHDLRSAAERGEIIIHYQPQARIGGEVIGFEALVRWNHPARGMIAPSAFISVAEESGLIVPLGEWILREACREAASWARPLAVGVNLSPVQFRHGDLAASVHAILLETGLAPGRLELEITEGVLMGDFSRAVSVLRRLKALGVKIAMDDFGTGYSSLSYLQTFPFDKIKIDRSFVSNVQVNPQSATIIRAVIGLGRGLNLPIIAEGVETQGELDFLAGEACDEVQGYLVGRPAPIAQYAELVGRAPEPVVHPRFAKAG
jgi:diguanylate cyclase (GGDEF)-like protein